LFTRKTRKDSQIDCFPVFLFVVFAVGFGLHLSILLGQTAFSEHWIGTWFAATAGQRSEPDAPAPINFKNRTLRQIVHGSVGGDRVRIVVTNAFGTAPLTIGRAVLSLRGKGAAVEANSSRPLTFGGKESALIPGGSVLVSDAVNLLIPNLSDLAIDLYLPGDTTDHDSPLTTHYRAWQTNYVSQAGDHTGEVSFPVETTVDRWFVLARVEVATREPVGAIVVFGDSIADGGGSTPDTNGRWPDQLARRIAVNSSSTRMAVLNAGLGGNRVLSDSLGILGPNALARFDRDVLTQTGVTHVIIHEGINDIHIARQPTGGYKPPSAENLIDAYRQMIVRAHARGIRVIGGTLLPFEGAPYWTLEGEAKRKAINEWIRTSKDYDGVIDFDAILRDPKQPTRLRADYSSTVRLHPNDAGYRAMANGIDLSLFSMR
jgi:lysophospholipase L1-like esterase